MSTQLTAAQRAENAKKYLFAKRSKIYADLSEKGEVSWTKQLPAREVTKLIEKIDRVVKAGGVNDIEALEKKIKDQEAKLDDLKKKLDAAKNGGLDEEVMKIIEATEAEQNGSTATEAAPAETEGVLAGV